MKKKQTGRFKIDVNSLKFRVWITYMLFSALIIALLWISQVFFLRYYLNGYKRGELSAAADEIVAHYGEEAFYGATAAKLGCSLDIMLLGAQGYSVYYTTNGLNYGTKNSLAKGNFTEVVKSIAKGEGFFKDNANSRLIYSRYMNSEHTLVLVLSQSTAQSDSTISVLQTQMWIATITIVVLAVCVSLLMSGFLSKDISKLSEASKELAKCDYNVRFEEKGCTEIAEIAGTLNYATGEIAKVEKLRRELIANVSHDLRTPLTLIKGYAEMIRDLSGDDKQRREANLEVIIKETDRLTVLVRDMLNLSQLESDNNAPEFEVLSLSQLIQSASNSFFVLNEKDGYNITCTVESELYVSGDSMRLQLATYNLIGNAVNYTGEDKSVRIRLYRKGAVARFEVIDTGEGVSEEQRSRIWEKYYRAKEHKRSVVGSGLGLSIVKTVLELHNAAYGMDSEQGKGSTFWYELPLTDNKTEE